MALSVSFMEMLASFGVGFLTFISPCVFPIIPSYLAYISGTSFEDLTDESKSAQMRKSTTLHSLMFVIGFSIIFTALGATATLIGGFFKQNMDVLIKVAGLVVFFFGLHLTGLIKLNFLMKDHRVEMKSKPAGYLGSILVGMAFGAGWSPCVGPMLGTALSLASTKETVWAGIIMLGLFSLGLGLPFIVAGLAFNSFLNYFSKAKRYLQYFTVFGGAFLMVMGITLFSGKFGIFSAWIMQKIPFGSFH